MAIFGAREHSSSRLEELERNANVGMNLNVGQFVAQFLVLE